MIVDDKEFSDWILIDNNSGGPAINLSDIEVTGDPGDPLNPGIIFTASNGALSAGGGDFLSLDFAFQVTVLDPTMRIKDNTLGLSQFGFIGVNDFISIDEIVCSSANCFSGSADEIAAKNVFADGSGNANLLDIQNFAPQTSIWVTTSILVNGRDIAAQLLQFNQYFSQEAIRPTGAPEPGTLALFVLGLAGLMVRRRRA